MAYCRDIFTLTVTGALDCTIAIGSDDDSRTFSADDLAVTFTQTVNFTYTIGIPKRTNFFHKVERSRAGGTGSPPSLGRGVVFSPAAPVTEDKAADEVQRASFSFGMPVYSNQEKTELAEGSDTFLIKIYAHEDSDNTASFP